MLLRPSVRFRLHNTRVFVPLGLLLIASSGSNPFSFYREFRGPAKYEITKERG